MEKEKSRIHFGVEGRKKKVKPIIEKNITRDPSYSNLKIPYAVICRDRTKTDARVQKKQFIKELKIHEMLQDKALDGVRVHREFCNPIIEEPKAIDMIVLTGEEKRQLEEILEFGFYKKVVVPPCPPLEEGLVEPLEQK